MPRGSSTSRSSAPRPTATFTFGRDHFHTEEHIRAAGLAHTFLRDSIYTDYIPVFATPDGEIRGPAGRRARLVGHARRHRGAPPRRCSPRPPTHVDKTYEMTGPEALTMAETVALLAEIVGPRGAATSSETIEEAWESRRPTGAPDWEIEGWITSYTSIAESARSRRCRATSSD